MADATKNGGTAFEKDGTYGRSQDVEAIDVDSGTIGGVDAKAAKKAVDAPAVTRKPRATSSTTTAKKRSTVKQPRPGTFNLDALRASAAAGATTAAEKKETEEEASVLKRVDEVKVTEEQIKSVTSVKETSDTVVEKPVVAEDTTVEESTPAEENASSEEMAASLEDAAPAGEPTEKVEAPESEPIVPVEKPATTPAKETVKPMNLDALRTAAAPEVAASRAEEVKPMKLGGADVMQTFSPDKEENTLVDDGREGLKLVPLATIMAASLVTPKEFSVWLKRCLKAYDRSPAAIFAMADASEVHCYNHVDLKGGKVLFVVGCGASITGIVYNRTADDCTDGVEYLAASDGDITYVKDGSYMVAFGEHRRQARLV